MKSEPSLRKLKLAWLYRFVCLSFVLGLVSPITVFASTPGSIQLAYDIYKGNLRIGRIEESYSREKDQYTLTSTTRAVGFLAIFKPGKIMITSHGLVSKTGLQPLSFSDYREGANDKNRQAEFDWTAGKLTLISPNDRKILDLPAGTQDRLSAMYQFMFLPMQLLSTVDFTMTNGNKLDDYHYVVQEMQQLKTSAGEFSTLYLDNQPKPGERRTEIWLAIQQYNLPCKMTITEADGGQLTQILSKLEAKP